MRSLVTHLLRSWTTAAIRELESLRRGLSETFPVDEDPPPTTPYEVVYEAGKVSLRHYRAEPPAAGVPLLLVYALVKRPYILDLQPGRSVIESLTRRGFEVYLTDWIPPTRHDAGRGFAAYVTDVRHSVEEIRRRHGADRVSILGYCFGGLLATIYTALHPATVRNLVTLTLPLDLGARDGRSAFGLVDRIPPATIDLIVDTYGNCPAWMIHAGFGAMAPLHHALDKHVGLYRASGSPGYEETFALFERWMADDVPLAGRIFRELTNDLLRKNLLYRNAFEVGGRTVDLGAIACPVLNVIGDYDDIVPPAASRAFVDLVGSHDKRNLCFPNGHMGLAVSEAAQAKLWPEVAGWLKERSG